MTWGNIKKGDHVLVVNYYGTVFQDCVASAGNKWIVVQGRHGRFSAIDGKGPYGRVHTESTFAAVEAEKAERLRKMKLIDTLRVRIRPSLSLATLEAIAQLVAEDTPT